MTRMAGLAFVWFAVVKPRNRRGQTAVTVVVNPPWSNRRGQTAVTEQTAVVKTPWSNRRGSGRACGHGGTRAAGRPAERSDESRPGVGVFRRGAVWLRGRAPRRGVRRSPHWRAGRVGPGHGAHIASESRRCRKPVRMTNRARRRLGVLPAAGVRVIRFGNRVRGSAGSPSRGKICDFSVGTCVRPRLPAGSACLSRTAGA